MNPIQASSMPIWGFAKIFVIIGLVIYIAFAFVVVKQVKMMTDTLEVQLEEPIKLMTRIHFAFAVGVLILAIVIL